MDEILPTMWKSLSLSKNESITLNINANKLSAPKHALVGKLAMKKHVSTFEVDKVLKSIWGAVNSMETTLLGDKHYLFAFSDANICDRVLNRKPWNF